jgi:hypothetical protein
MASTSRELEVIGRENTINNITGDQYLYNITVVNQVDSGKAPESLVLNDAPLDLLSVHFIGRNEELDRIGKILDTVREDDDVPARCVIQGMHGLGKTQLALQFAKLSFKRQRYSLIFWISATTVEKLSQGFVDLLNLVGHPDRSHPEQSTRLKAARRWLEDANSIDWLLILDNVDRNTISFIREHLPRRNQRGNIIFTTRPTAVASALACVAGQQHEVLELGLPDLREAATLLLAESNINATSVTISKAENVVKRVGRLPLAISQAASFMKESRKNLDEILLVFEGQQIQVCYEFTLFCAISPS